MNWIINLFKSNSGILGINRRNQEYVRMYNPTASRVIADNKILTKRVLGKIGIQTPKAYKVIRTKRQLSLLDWQSLPKSFVLKPNQGTGGNGILVFVGKKKNSLEWIRANGSSMDQKELELHIEKILDGSFSMGNRQDIAIVEERIRIDKVLKPYTYKGVPDVRVIVFNKVPVMAMLRLPTKRSNGTANLHSGAICSGIDIASGLTTTSMYLAKKPFIEDTYTQTDMTLDLDKNMPLSGISIPYWDEILKIAIKAQEISELGYLGVDIAIDRDQGPMVFEINARPGLGIQVANQEGLRKRLERIKGLKIKSINHAIRVAKNLFGGEVEEEIESISGKKLVNLIEKISVSHIAKLNKKGNVKPARKEVVNAFLDTSKASSRIHEKLASTIGLYSSIKRFKELNIPKFNNLDEAFKYVQLHEEAIVEQTGIKRLSKVIIEGKVELRPVFDINITISKEEKTLEMLIDTEREMGYSVVIGRKDLKEYLIDPSKTFSR